MRTSRWAVGNIASTLLVARLAGFALMMIALVAGVIGLAVPRVNDFAGPANLGPHRYFFGPLPGPVAQTFRIETPFVSSTDVWIRVSGVDGEWPQFIGVLRDSAGAAQRRGEILGFRGVGGTPGGWWQVQWKPPLKAHPGDVYLLEVQPVNPHPEIIIEIAVTVGEAYPSGQFFRAGDMAAEPGQDLVVRNFTDVTLARALLNRLTPSAGGIGVVAVAMISSLMSIGAAIFLAWRFGLPLRVATPAVLASIATLGSIVLTVGTHRLVFEAVADESVVPLAQLSGIVTLPISLLVLGVGVWLIALIGHRRTYGDLRQVVPEPIVLLAFVLRALLGIRTPALARRVLGALAEHSAGGVRAAPHLLGALAEHSVDGVRAAPHLARETSDSLTFSAQTITRGLARGLLAVAVTVVLIGGKLTAPLRRALRQLVEQSEGLVREPQYPALDPSIRTLSSATITGGLALGLLAAAVPVALVGGKLTAPILPSAAFTLMLVAVLIRWLSTARGS